MTNKEHLTLIRQGIDIWNKWRDENPAVIPDFSGTLSHFWYHMEAECRGNKVKWGTDFFSASHESEALPHNLSGFNLSGANLSRVHLGGTSPSGKDVNGSEIEANLSGANLSNANLSGACLNGANLTDANLSNADLSGALLHGTNLSRANLNNADLSGAGIEFTDFTGASLKGTKFARVKFDDISHLSKDGSNDFKLKFNLGEADLSKADMRKFDLSDANLSGVSLNEADLSDANLIRADLSGTDLRRANLARTQALYTNFSSAKLTGACLEDWNINRATTFDGVICDYFYWSSGQQERRPRKGNLAAGEFTALFQKALETVDLIFTNGLDWTAFFASFQKLQVKCDSDELFIQAFENKNGIFIIRLNVPIGADKGEIEKYLKRQYELEAQLQAKNEQLANLMEITKLLASRPINVEARAIAESESMSEASKYNQRHAQIGSLVDTARDNSRQQSINHQHNYAPEQKQNLVEAAAEIQQLLQQLEQTYPTNTPLEKQLVVTEALKQIESNPTLKARVIGALKASGIEALKELVDNPLINILVAALEGWQEAE
jgi:uncharacterized protein YjbI with pentapeptide repeats